jgi:hypothetical protein
MLFRFNPLATTISLLSLVYLPTLMAADDKDWLKGVAVDGRVEVEGSYQKDYNRVSSSDLVLAKALWGFTGNVHEWSTARLSFLYEAEGSLKVDEIFITLGNLNAFPFYVKAGQMYLPFGKYETLLVSDPVTYNIAHIMRSIGQLGLEAGGAYGTVYGYNGDTQKGSSNVIDHYGATLGFTKESDKLSFEVGVDYLSDFGDLSGPSGVMKSVGSANNWANYNYVNGLVGHTQVKLGPVTFNGEYMTALDEFQSQYLSFGSSTPLTGARPKAWYIELGYTIKIDGKDTTVALSYQATDEALTMGLPEQGYLAGISVEMVNNTSLSLEYKRETNYSQQEGGTGGHLDTVTVQLAVDF